MARPWRGQGRAPSQKPHPALESANDVVAAAKADLMSGDRPVAVVTGANRGIGREVARQLAGSGYRVVLGSRDLAKGQQAANELDASGERILACRLDVCDDAGVAEMVTWVIAHLGRADVVINNAAIRYDTWAMAISADLD
jgi:NAD(P)-dependent dehydrogenase (short-subunit alcohol dehydrogenase family)